MSHGHLKPEPLKEKFLTPGVMVMLALIAIGGVFALARFIFGIGYVSNLSNQFPWGLWVAVDVATGVALAAGGFTTGLIAYVFNREQYHAVIRPALLTAMLGYTFVVLGLLVDIGRYWNITSPLFNHNPNSVLFEVAMCVMIYLHVLYIEFLPVVIERFQGRVNLPGFLSRFNERVDRSMAVLGRALDKVMFVFIIAGIVLSCLHQSSLGTLMLIAPSKVHPLWYTPILPAMFLLSAFAAGYPMVTFESLIVAKSFGREPEMDVLTPLAKYMPVFMGAYLAVKLGDMIVRGTYVYLLDGTYQSNAFIVEVLVGVVLPFVMLLSAKVRRSPGWLFFASALYVLGILLNRINVFMVSYTPPYKIASYFPSVGEIFITVGLIACLMLLYRVCVFIFPVLGKKPEHMTAAAFVLAPLALLLLASSPALAAPQEPNRAAAPRALKGDPLLGQAPPLFTLDSKVIKKGSDLYGPVRFMHRKHAQVLKDCTICHHRQPRQKGDTYGLPVTMDNLINTNREPVKCSECHAEPFNPKQLQTPGLKGAYHRLCMDCHKEADQTPHQRGPVMYSSMVRGPEVRPLDTRAPTDCLACHAKNTPDHKNLVKLSGQTDALAVTKNCLSCHEKEGEAILKSAHWKWHGPSPFTKGHEKRNDLGKHFNTINNFCINLNSNWPRCTSCHIGYGFKDADFDFNDKTRIDCLVCHDTTGTYKKAPAGAGFPEKNVDLIKVAKSVGRPTRDTCGMNCHLVGGGSDGLMQGNAQSHAASLQKADDVHMGAMKGGMNFNCQDCHKTRNHMISGRSIAVATTEGDLSCEYCHTDAPHPGNRLTAHHLNKHTKHVACQTCHIPTYARNRPTKIGWDWSTAGKDINAPPDKYGMPTYDKLKGSFTWAKNAKPEYRWYNGTVKRHLLGDRLGKKRPVELAAPVGDITDRSARIYPFKINRGRQIADSVNKYLITPKLWQGFWKDFDWNKAAAEGMKASKLAYSGKHEFVDTVMYWGLTHEVAPKEDALSCAACHASMAKEPHCAQCHGENPAADYKELANRGITAHKPGLAGGYVDYKALGYAGDPMETGGRFKMLPMRAVKK